GGGGGRARGRGGRAAGRGPRRPGWTLDAPWPWAYVLLLASARRYVARQPVPRPRLRRIVERGRALVVAGALRDAEVRLQIGRAHEAARTLGVLRACRLADFARIGVRDEEEARAAKAGAAVIARIARAALRDRAVALDPHARTGGAAAAIDLVAMLGRAVRRRRTAGAERARRRDGVVRRRRRMIR